MSKEDILRKIAELQGSFDNQYDKLKLGLPHIYSQKHYGWSRQFYDSANKMCLLTAANQIGKSTVQIKKAIELSGNPKKWNKFFPKRPPTQFWYLYPDKDTATREWIHKWLPLMPSHEFQDHETYGWKATLTQKKIVEVKFNSGVTIYFRTYSQDAHNLQSGTVDAIFCDEELPVALYPELRARLFSSDGLFNMVFTATLNQDQWRRAMEGVGDTELFPAAHKQQISMRDCIHYEDGSDGAFTEESIKNIEAGCANETERARRVDGKFVTEDGRKYHAFDATRHFIKPFPIPETWQIRMTVDIGSGGLRGHPPAISFLAISPDFRKAVVYKAWRGDSGEDFTAADVFLKAMEMETGENVTVRKFDQQCKDFGVIAERAGVYFEPSVKSHELGEAAVNSLFANDMVHLFDDDYEIAKMGGELTSLMKGKAKKYACDDLADTLRYGVTDVPWDWTKIRGLPSEAELKAARDKRRARRLTDKELAKKELDERRGLFEDRRNEDDKAWDEITGHWEEFHG